MTSQLPAPLRPHFRAPLLQRSAPAHHHHHRQKRKSVVQATERDSSSLEQGEPWCRRQAVLILTSSVYAGKVPAVFATPLKTAPIEELRAEGLLAETAVLEREAEAKAELEKRRRISEAEAKLTQEGKLCATPFGVDIVGITQTVALIGAIVGGVIARARQKEVDTLNEKLRNVNRSLRKQARNMQFAPGLSYAPQQVGGTSAAANGTPTVTDPQVEQARIALKEGKQLLQDASKGNVAASLIQFKKALVLSRTLGNRILERRAMRGLSAAKRLNGDLKAAAIDLRSVLEISEELQEFTGFSDALGIIADIYTEMGDLESAGKYYDQYLAALTTEEMKVDNTPSGNPPA